MLVEFNNIHRREKINSIKHAKDVARYMNYRNFLIIDGERVTGFSRPKGQRNWTQEEL